MSLLKLKDGGGNLVELYEYEGTAIPKFPLYASEADVAKHIEAIKAMKARDDDVVICGFPKSGCHWTWEVIHMLANGKAEYAPYVKETRMMESTPMHSLDSLTSPRILNSHLPFRQLPCDLIARRCKMVYLLRNPKDICVSFYHHLTKKISFNYEAPWNDYFPMFLGSKYLYQSWFEYVRDWEKEINDDMDLSILTIAFEDMKKDPLCHTKKIADFLEITYDDKLIKDISDKCSFQNLREANDTVKHDVIKKSSRDGKSFMYRKGDVGDWKNWFTVAQNEQFDAVFADKMKGSNVKVEFEL